jgi:hypothetical protein
MIGMRKGLEMTPGWGRWEPAVWIACLGFIAMALFAHKGAAQETARQPITLSGTVENQAGLPLVGAFVSVSEAKIGSLTNANGRFSLPDVMPGKVSLTAVELGYDTLTVDRTAVAGVPVTLTMTPKPVLLQGLRVVVNRLKQRRESTAFSVQEWGRGDLVTSPDNNMKDFLRGTMGLSLVPCPASALSDECILRENYMFEPTVYINEVPVLGGLDYLESYSPSDLYMIESYGHGAEIRAYTTGFMARAAMTRLQPIPLLF